MYHYNKTREETTMKLKQTVTKAALSTAMDHISGDPEKNLPKPLNFAEGLGWDDINSQTK